MRESRGVDGGDLILTFQWEQGLIPTYVKRVLINGCCETFFKTSIRDRDQRTELSFACGGFQALKDWNPGNIKRGFLALEALGLSLIEAINYFMQPQQFIIDTSTVYVEVESEDRSPIRKVKLIYLPRLGLDCPQSLMSCPQELLLIRELTLQWKNIDLYGYLPKLEAYIEAGNPSVLGWVNKIGEFRKEIYGSAWDN